MGLVIIHYTPTSPHHQRSLLRPVTSKETVVNRFEFIREKEGNDAGTRFGKQFCVSVVCIQDQSLNNFENDTIKLSVNEAELTGLRARNCATIQQVLIIRFAFRSDTLPGLSRNEPLVCHFDATYYGVQVLCCQRRYTLHPVSRGPEDGIA